MPRREEYGVLVLALEERDGGDDADGVETLELEVARVAFLERARGEAREKHEQLLASAVSEQRAYEMALERYDAELLTYREQAIEHEETVAAYAEQIRIHKAASRRAEEEQHWHDEALRVYTRAYTRALAKHQRRLPVHPGAAPKGPGPAPDPPGPAPEEPSRPPPPETIVPLGYTETGTRTQDHDRASANLPTDDELMQDSTPKQLRAWTARLTTVDTALLVGTVLPDGIAPPPRFVTDSCNAAAAAGWSVHHVAEDRVMAHDEVQLVAVRYLLRRTVA